jgi:heterotetrameric sarcosine oxidase gamma subunit
MASASRPDDFITGTGLAELTVRVDETVAVGTLRHFASGGAFGARLAQATGLALPDTGAAVASEQLTLAWRSPTETLCVAPDAARLRELESRLGATAQGYLVNLTGGMRVLRLEGARVGALLSRLGGRAHAPAAGESRPGRLADVPVLSVGVPQRAGEVLLLVDRAYAPHLLGWIRETVADFS